MKFTTFLLISLPIVSCTQNICLLTNPKDQEEVVKQYTCNSDGPVDYFELVPFGSCPLNKKCNKTNLSTKSYDLSGCQEVMGFCCPEDGQVDIIINQFKQTCNSFTGSHLDITDAKRRWTH